MKKYIIPILMAILLICLVSFIYFQNNNLRVGNKNNSNTYEATRTDTATNITSDNQNTDSEITVPIATEQEISSFSTNVSGTSARKINISICASELNNTIIQTGQSFSFWETVGSPTADRGYQKAKSFDEHGKTIQTYGGGVCQVSTTLYNAVLASSDLNVTERHPHSKQVTYVPKDKDASVCYSASDFKFVNNSSNSIKIYANYEQNTLTVRLVKLSNS